MQRKLLNRRSKQREKKKKKLLKVFFVNFFCKANSFVSKKCHNKTHSNTSFSFSSFLTFAKCQFEDVGLFFFGQHKFLFLFILFPKWIHQKHSSVWSFSSSSSVFACLLLFDCKTISSNKQKSQSELEHTRTSSSSSSFDFSFSFLFWMKCDFWPSCRQSQSSLLPLFVYSPN